MVLMCACMDPVAPGKQLHQALPEPDDACLVCQAVRNGTASIQHRSYIDVLLHVVRSISRVRTLVCSLHPLWWCRPALGAGSALDVCSFVGAASWGNRCRVSFPTRFQAVPSSQPMFIIRHPRHRTGVHTDAVNTSSETPGPPIISAILDLSREFEPTGRRFDPHRGSKRNAGKSTLCEHSG